MEGGLIFRWRGRGGDGGSACGYMQCLRVDNTNTRQRGTVPPPHIEKPTYFNTGLGAGSCPVWPVLVGQRASGRVGWEARSK